MINDHATACIQCDRVLLMSFWNLLYTSSFAIISSFSFFVSIS